MTSWASYERLVRYVKKLVLEWNGEFKSDQLCKDSLKKQVVNMTEIQNN